MEANLNLSPNVTHQPSLLGGAENMKLLFDNVMTLTQAALIDNQRDARRRASNDAAYDHLVSMAAASGLLNSNQIAQDKLDTASGAEETADAGTSVAAEGVAVSAQTVATSLGNLLTFMISAGGTLSPASLAAAIPAIVQAAAQPKSASAA